MTTSPALPLAEALFDKHVSLNPTLGHYTGIVSLHGLTRLAVISGDTRLREKILATLAPFVEGQRHFKCNFPNYRCGGIGTAYLLWQGWLPSARDTVRHYAEEILQEAPRTPQGIVCHPTHPESERIWIDAAFAVTPFLLFAGLALQEDRYIEDAFQQTAKMVGVFRNPTNGLLHQSKNFNGPGRLSEDAWSRGNGWGIYALGELAAHLPPGDPRRDRAVAMFTDLLEACLAALHPDGLWCQEMTDHTSYIETSGSGLILYALGLALEHRLLGAEKNADLVRGLSALLPYITAEHDVHQTCRGCLCPGRGTKLDYMARAPQVNDPHAFGPLILAFGQAHALGLHTIERNPLS
jgi:unsaturated rhamnogalacturonyl hydrolase